MVIGGGNEAISAAVAAKKYGAKVLVVEKATPSERGGNCQDDPLSLYLLINTISYDMVPAVFYVD